MPKKPTTFIAPQTGAKKFDPEIFSRSRKELPSPGSTPPPAQPRVIVKDGEVKQAPAASEKKSTGN